MMRNKGYVAGILALAAVLTYAAIRILLGDGGLAFAIVPAALAGACVLGAVKVAKAESFSPKAATRWDDRSTAENVQRWIKEKADRPPTKPRITK